MNSYSVDDIDYLHNNFGKKSYKELAEALNRTENSIRQKCFRLNIKAKESYQGHNYISETQFVKELKDLNLDISLAIYLSLRDKNVIKTFGDKFQIKFLKHQEASKWLDFFKTHYHTRYVKNTLLDKKYHKRFDKWLTCKCIPSVVLVEKHQYKYWVHKTEVEKLLNLLKNFLPVTEFAKKIGYTIEHISKLRLKGVLTKYIHFANKYWYEKSELNVLKERLKTL